MHCRGRFSFTASRRSQFVCVAHDLHAMRASLNTQFWVIPKYLHKHKHSSRRADDIRTYRIAALIKFILIYNLYRYLSAFDVCRYNFTNVKNCLIWIILQTKYNFNFNYIQLFLGKNKRRFLTARHTILYLN